MSYIYILVYVCTCCEVVRLTDVLAFVEGLWYLAREDGVNGAHYDQHDGVEEGDRVGCVHVRVTHEHIVLAGRVVVNGSRRRYDLPHHDYHHLPRYHVLYSYAFSTTV